MQASFTCPVCDEVLATYQNALLGLSVENASWSEQIGTAVFLSPGLVNLKSKHLTGLPAYGPGKRSSVGRRQRPGIRIRLPAIVTCRCGAESRLAAWANSELAQAWDDERHEIAKKLNEEMETAERREAFERQNSAWTEYLKERVAATRKSNDDR